MKWVFFPFVFVLFSNYPVSGNNTDTIPQKTVNLYGEIFGSAFLSFNAEKLFFAKQKSAISIRAGMGIYPSKLGLFGGNTEWSFLLPVTSSYIYGRNFALEAGAGICLGFDQEEDAFENTGPLKWFTGNLGFRYQKRLGGFLLKIAYTPHFLSRKRCYDVDCLNYSRHLEVRDLFGLSFGARI